LDGGTTMKIECSIKTKNPHNPSEDFLNNVLSSFEYWLSDFFTVYGIDSYNITIKDKDESIAASEYLRGVKK
jgi:hypothetical protein